MSYYAVGSRVRTARGEGVVRHVQRNLAVTAYDIFFGDGQPGFCYLKNGNWPGWGRYLAEEIVSLTDSGRVSKRKTRSTFK